MDIEKTTTKVFASSTVTKVISFVAIAYFSAVLGASGIGIYFLFEAVVGVVSIPSNLGIHKAVAKRISEGENQGKFLTTAIIFKLIPLGVVGGVLYVFRALVQNYIGITAIYYILIYLFINQYFKLSQKILQGERKVEISAYLRFFEKVLFLIIGSVLVYLNTSPISLMMAKIVSELVILMGAGLAIDTAPKWPDMKSVKSLTDYSRYSLISHVGGYTYNWMDVLMIGYFMAPSYVGAYEVAWRITKISSLSGAVGTTIFPEISRLQAEEKFNEISTILRDSVYAGLYLVIPSLIGGAILASELLETIYGEEFVIASIALIILLLEKVFHSMHKIYAESLQAVDRPDLSAIATLLAVFINLLLNFTLIPMFGIGGAATATLISFASNTLIHMYLLNKLINITFPVNRIIVSFGSALAMGSIVYIYTFVLGQLSLVELVIGILLGAFIYIGLTLQNRDVRAHINRHIPI
jgi:O-antigen/teichoic acid export membrane protein